MKVLITGGSGLVGKDISQKLLKRGDEVVWLSRKEDLTSSIKRYQWDINKGYINPKAFDGVDAVIHLAGKSVGDGRWTASVKKEILESRILSTRLLNQYISQLEYPPKVVVCASAVGIYGDTSDTTADENSSFGHDFLSDVVVKWEEEQQKIAIDRLVQLRIGVVLSQKGGALPKIMAPIKMCVGSALGSGDQWMSWISLNDLSNMFIYTLDHKVEGVFNAVSKTPITNSGITKEIASAINKPFFLPNVPSLILKVMLGESAALVLNSSKVVSSKKLGYVFEEHTIKDVLEKEI
ncbi:TIGR01777 family oxidoreductase [Flammeovirga pacifica]|uniref:TIGR01777 family protein n=1 Tax=Flammeovirga pacifica TaxID=915059 RepID=A0A1S1Z2I4_FLAPC|nr:TIGR01777 family oxidoreductase [Flammeovirga pacifica]OHX67484.1 TIGR01777 family protein [Flammeovirga pacifica]